MKATNREPFVPAPHLLFLLGIAGVSMANQSFMFAIILFTAYAGGMLHTYLWGRSIGRVTETVLAVLAVAVALLYSGSQGLHHLFSLQYWLALMLVIRSYRRMERRDYGFCFLISAALFAHVARTYDDLPFVLLMLAAFILAPYALFHFLAQYGGFRKTDRIKAPLRPAFTAAQFRFMTVLSILLFLVSVAIFLVLPRASGSSLLGSIREDRDKRATGFSENVALGTFSEVVQNPAIVMTVESERPALWRGGVLDYYEGGVWYGAARYQQRQPHEVMPAPANRREVKRRFEIFDVRLTGFRLFSSGTIISIRQFNEIWKPRVNDVYSTVMITHVETIENCRGGYEVVSDAGEFTGAGEFRNRRWPVPTSPSRLIPESDLFLQLPADLSARVKNLALEITRGLNSPEEKADAVQRYLSSGYTYTLKNLNSGRTQALEYFLFETKAGHCEYFASSMAILLRCAGVRTRVVQGFAPGTLVNGKYVVRLSDAHLWTEVFFPGKGWKSYDPTPGQDDRLNRGQPMSQFEMLKLNWQSYVLNYDRGMQLAVFQGLNNRFAATFKMIKDGAPSARNALIVLLGVSLAALAIRYRGILGQFRLRFKMSGDRNVELGKVAGYFRQYLKLIARKGYKRGPATTPNDLLAALERDKAPVLDDAALLTGLFYRTRFGDGKLSPYLQQETERALRRIRKWAS